MLPNKRNQYYVNDDVTFRGVFKIDGEEQTPDPGTCLVTIMKEETSTPIVDNAAGDIAGQQLRYQFANMPVGRYAIFLTAKYNNGADERTGVIEFIVKNKEAN
jgi:hypothetical protein